MRAIGYRGKNNIMPCKDDKAPPSLVPVLGALASLALHALLIAPLELGLASGANQHSIRSIGIADKLYDPQSLSATLTLITDPELAVDGQPGDMSNTTPHLRAVPIRIPAPKVNFPVEDDAETNRDQPTDLSNSDPGAQLMLGRYIGQIAARIERAWTRPRAPIDSPVFACRVRITQDGRGVVKEIELIWCNGNSRWQTSLVQAIQTASPLPAPPDADVFTGQLTLDLRSAVFTPGGSAEGFEPEVRQ